MHGLRLDKLLPLNINDKSIRALFFRSALFFSFFFFLEYVSEPFETTWIKGCRAVKQVAAVFHVFQQRFFFSMQFAIMFFLS